MDEYLIKIKDLDFSYGGRAIYKNLSMDIPRGKITAILGPSGTGKTTLLRLIGAQLYPERGEVLFDGINVHRLKRVELYELRKRMSMLFQSGALFTDMTVYENVAFPLREHTLLPEELIHDLVTMKLEAVGLRGAAKLMPSELSGGMARRAALARSIALDPDLIMYDEPFVGQDPITMGVLVKLISDLNASLGITSLIVTHSRALRIMCIFWPMVMLSVRVRLMKYGKVKIRESCSLLTDCMTVLMLFACSARNRIWRIFNA